MAYPTYIVVPVAPPRVESFLNAVADLFRRAKQEHWAGNDGYSIISIWNDPAAPASSPKVCIALSCHFDYIDEQKVRAANGVDQ